MRLRLQETKSPPQPAALRARSADKDAARLQVSIGNQAVLRSRETKRRPEAGEPLAASAAIELGARFGHALSTVRIHTDDGAARQARSLGANAYTVGEHIVFGQGRYRPGTTEGQALLAHELVHVLQNRRFGPAGDVGRATSGADAPDEREARVVAHRVLSSRPPVGIEVTERPTAVAQRESIAPTEKAEEYLPDPSELEAHLAKLDTAGREKFVETLLKDVKARWERAEAAGLIKSLRTVRGAEKKMAKSATQPVAGLPLNTPKAFREYLMLNAGGAASTALGRDLVTDSVPVADVASTAGKATNAVMNLRRLDDVLVRALAAKQVVDETGTPLPDVLAMYRTEGDMNAPASTASIAAGIPPGTTDAETKLRTKPDISHLVWLVDPAKAPWSDATFLERALSQWFVQIGGLDAVGKLAMPKRLPFIAWSSGNWLAAQGQDLSSTSAETLRIKDEASQHAAARWDKLLANMEIARPVATSGSTAVMVTPKDPETMTVGILSEAVMFQRALAKTQSFVPGAPAVGPGSELSKGMSYLHYHAGTDQFRMILPSAAIAAAATSIARFSALRKAMKGSLDIAGLRTRMTTVDANLKKLKDPKLSSADRATLTAENDALRADMWTLLESWLSADSSRIGLLGQFIETADTSIWSAWDEHRGNLSRYNVLRAYYELL